MVISYNTTTTGTIDQASKGIKIKKEEEERIILPFALFIIIILVSIDWKSLR